MEPSQASAHSAMTRPRIVGLAASEPDLTCYRPCRLACRHPLLYANDKTGKHHERARTPGRGTDFAHSVTIFASVIDRIAGPESVQSGRVMFL